ncbi:hypothetical protein E4K67_23980 [Desulfosporosinus fructosivorans]|uniref:Uncharacterized protein n=1 Tax=Desulfosporosinus fructosivorans TaxID=2018669 RepID=A0A4Z0QYT6_9FIRM|nr:hypothetical protein [Desulfosporosinus fructosivorans]TGE35600.1 hypothetical protein E4K67_23980 [Desulfosporosinus fructosivorans]
MVLDLETKAQIITILGEEMFDVCLEKPDKAAAFSWLLSLSIAEFDKENGLDSVISNKLLESKEELGEELCIWYSKNRKGLVDILTILSSYNQTYENAKQTKEKYKRLFEALDSNNYDARIIPLTLASRPGDGTNRLWELFERTKIVYVRDLGRLLTMTLDETDSIELFKLLQWLSEDKLATLINELHSLFKRTRDKDIIRKRARGATLEETSTHYGLTHEGVRMIGKKFQTRFDRYISRIMPHYILYAFSKNTCYLSIEDINERLSDLSDIFTYCLKLNNCSAAHWSDQLNGFIIGDGKWYEQLIDYKKGLPEILDCESLDDLITDMIDNLALPIVFDDAQRLVLADYHLSGKVFLKKKINLSRMYYAVLEKYYPDGIKLYDNYEAIRFRNYVRGLFGDVYLPKNNRAIDVRLTDLTILCDRGKRILPSGIKISIELLRKIHDAIIEFDRNEIMFIELFERFKVELLANSNITNKYFLQGVLKQNYSNEFNFTRYTCKK